jgi:N-glycosylase/DNA lyase
MESQISNQLEKAILKVYVAIPKKGNKQWSDHKEQELWYELVSCILGSKVPFEQARAYASYLNNGKLLDVRECLEDSSKFESRVCEALSSSITLNAEQENPISKYRYPKLRANHIRRTADSIYKNHVSINAILEESKDPYEARVNIINTSVGIGPKQASLFLRNIGYANDIAILDTHVLNYMFLRGILDVRVKSLSTLGKYQRIEEQLRYYTSKLGLILAYLDTAIWITMRVFNRECAK